MLQQSGWMGGIILCTWFVHGCYKHMFWVDFFIVFYKSGLKKHGGRNDEEKSPVTLIGDWTFVLSIWKLMDQINHCVIISINVMSVVCLSMLCQDKIHTAVAGMWRSVWGPVVFGTCSLHPTAQPQWWHRPGSGAARSESPTADETQPPTGRTPLLLITNHHRSMITHMTKKQV